LEKFGCEPVIHNLSKVLFKIILRNPGSIGNSYREQKLM